MNDDFLHRLRKEPPPEFLAGLEAKLAQQSPRPRSRRFSFSRGLFVGVLLATTAFAVTSLSINRTPQSFREFLTAPVELLAKMGGVSSPRADLPHRGPNPLGPAWLPTHGASQSEGDALEAPPPARRAPASPSVAMAAKSPATQSTVAPAPYGTLNIVATAATYPHALLIADGVSKRYWQTKVSLDKNGTALNNLCNPDSKGNPAVAVLYHRVTPAEIRNCARTLTEFKVGHQAIVLGRSKLYGALKLSARDLFLALARQIPIPTDPALVIDNPNTTWNQVNGTLPYDRIHLLGPALGGVPGKLAAALLLEAGCNTYPWIADLRSTNPARYEEICTTLRGDGAYEESEEGGWAFSENLVHDPTTLGVFTLSEFARAQDKIAASVIDGVEPSLETIVNSTYPVSRSFYLYANTRFWAVPFGNAIATSQSPFSNDPAGWGFVPLNAAERDDVQATLKRYQDSNF